MNNNSDDYLDRFSDQGMGGFDSFGEAFLRSQSVIANEIYRAKHRAEEYHLDPQVIEQAMNAAKAANASALCTGLYWVELKKNKQLSPNTIYVSEKAQELMKGNRKPVSNTYIMNLSPETIGLDPKRGSCFRVENAFSMKPDLKSRLTPIPDKLLQPAIEKKTLTVFTNYSTAFGIANGNIALVCIDDLISFVSRKTLTLFALGNQSVYFPQKDFQTEKEYFGKLSDEEKYQS